MAQKTMEDLVNERVAEVLAERLHKFTSAGGRARALALSPARRLAIAKKASKAAQKARQKRKEDAA